MATQNLRASQVKPDTSELLTLRVQRSERLSASFVRVTLGEGDIERFRPMGYDQWFRLFIPVPGSGAASLHTLGRRLANKLDTVSYLRYLTIARDSRPVLRNYTVRGYRPSGPGGPELDVDFVLHGEPGDATAGPAAGWARGCRPGDPVALLDEGIAFGPRPEIADRVLLVGDESGLPAIAGVLDSLPGGVTGDALIELPTEGDRQLLAKPDGVAVHWVVRPDPHEVPGRSVLAAARELAVGARPFYGWTVGEQALPTGLRRHLVAAGVPKSDITFCGYWRYGKAYT